MSLIEDKYKGSVLFSSAHLAVQACLEVLGSRHTPMVAVLPVYVSADVASGVLRAGVQPVVLDINAKDSQVRDDVFWAVKEELKVDPILICELDLDSSVSEGTEYLCQEFTAIAVFNCTLTESYYTLGQFSIYRLPYDTALVLTNDDADYNMLLQVRDSSVGIGGKLPDEWSDDVSTTTSSEWEHPYGNKVLLHRDEGWKNRFAEGVVYETAEEMYGKREE